MHISTGERRCTFRPVFTDPGFKLALRELDRLEDEALLRLTEEQKRQATIVGKTGKILQAHWQTQKNTVQADRRGPAYFASLIVLSAHAGLLGDADKERKLLIEYWERFAQAVPPDQALKVAKDIRGIVIKEGKFFQQHVDSGNYEMLIGAQKSEDAFLKHELRKSYHWPRYSVIWPFPDDLRGGFGFLSSVGKLDADWFDKNLPRYPHDYLKKVLDDVWDLSVKKDRERYAECLRLYLSIVRYYVRLAKKPSPLVEDLSGLHGALLSNLDDISVQAWDTSFLKEAVPILELLAKTETDPEKRELANKTLLRFVRQVKINEGQPVNKNGAKARPVSFTSLRLVGSPIVFVWYVHGGTSPPGEFKIDEFLLRAMSDTVRSIHVKTKFNVLWVGGLGSKQSPRLFQAPQAPTHYPQQILRAVAVSSR